MIYKMTAREVIITNSSSKGSQIKFYKDGYWYKLNESGREDLSEYIVSKLLECSSLPNSEYVKYELCDVEYKNKIYKACRSKSFLKEGETYISFEKFYKMMKGGNLTEDIIIRSDPKERIKYVVDFFKETINLDISTYISNTLSLDMLTLNPDRHLNNLGIIVNPEKDEYRCAPIFDNGAALLSNTTQFPMFEELSDLIKNVYGKPFSANLEYQAASAGITIRLDFKMVEEMLKTLAEPKSRAVEILKNQIQKYEKILAYSKPPYIIQCNTLLEKIREEQRKAKQKQLSILGGEKILSLNERLKIATDIQKNSDKSSQIAKQIVKILEKNKATKDEMNQFLKFIKEEGVLFSMSPDSQGTYSDR